MDHQWVSLDEMSRRLHVTKRTILRWWREDKIEIVKLSWKRAVIRPDEADRIEAEYKSRPGARLKVSKGDT